MTPQLPAASERPLARERLLLYLIPGLAALLVVTLFTLAFFSLVKSRDASLRDAERTTRDLAQIVEQRTARMLQSVDQTLRSAGDMWQQIPALRDPAGAGMHTLLAQKVAQLPNVRTLFVLDARGMLVHAFTRVYFAGDPLETDPTLALVDVSRRDTLVAERTVHQGGRVVYRWDIHLQGERETVFFDA